MTQEKSAKPKRPRRRLGIGGKKKKAAPAARKPAATRKPKAQRGRPAHVPNDKTRAWVNLCVSEGVSHTSIIALLGIDPKTFRKHYLPEISHGLDKVTVTMVGNLVAIANGRGPGAVQAAVAVLGRTDRRRLRLGLIPPLPGRSQAQVPPPPPPPPPPMPAQEKASTGENADLTNIMATVYSNLQASMRAAYVAINGEPEESQAQEKSDEQDEPAEAPEND